MKMKLIALAVSMIAFNASATSKDCGCTKTPTAYDKTQDVKISDNTSAIGDVKLTAGQAFDIAVEGRATADNALTTVYGLIPQVNNNAKGIADLQEQKVDKSVFTADQQRQDKALSDAVASQAATDAKQTSDLKSYADKKATSAYQTSVAHTDAKVARADADRKAGDDALQGQITSNLSTQAERDAGQDTHINAANANIQANRDAINSTNRVVSEHSAQLQNHEQRLTGLEESTNRNFASLKKQVERNKKDTDAGIASVGAMASIPQVTEYQTFNVGVGVGSRHDQQAVAVGFSARASQNVVIKVSVASDTNSSWTLGAGAAIGW